MTLKQWLYARFGAVPRYDYLQAVETITQRSGEVLALRTQLDRAYAEIRALRASGPS